MSDNAKHSSGDKGGQSGTLGCGGALGIGFVLYLIAFFVTDGFGLGYDEADFYGEKSSVYSEYETYLGNPIPRFDPTDARRLSKALSEAQQRYGVCFGWKLVDGTMDEESGSDTGFDPFEDSGSGFDGSANAFDRGSSRGPNVPASSCPRWVEVRATVAYTDEDSEQWSAVELEVAASSNFDSDELPGIDDFAELGIDARTFINQPVNATGHAALALPLLLVQSGALEPKPVPEAAGKPDRPLPPAGGWPNGLATWIWIGVLGAITITGLALGFRAVAREKSRSRSTG